MSERNNSDRSNNSKGWVVMTTVGILLLAIVVLVLWANLSRPEVKTLTIKAAILEPVAS